MYTTISKRKVWDDLNSVFLRFPVRCLQHVLTNRHRLISGSYQDAVGNGCLFYLLSELLPSKIDSREALTRFFTGAVGYPASESETFKPARWLVRLIDCQICDRVRDRYGDDVRNLPWDTVIECLQEHLAIRMQTVERGMPRKSACGQRAARRQIAVAASA